MTLKSLAAATGIVVLGLTGATVAAHAQLYQPYTYNPPSYTTQRIGPFDYTNGSDGSNYTTQHIGPFGYTNGTDGRGNSVNCTSQRIGQFVYTNCN